MAQLAPTDGQLLSGQVVHFGALDCIIVNTPLPSSAIVFPISSMRLFVGVMEADDESVMLVINEGYERSNDPLVPA